MHLATHLLWSDPFSSVCLAPHIESPITPRQVSACATPAAANTATANRNTTFFIRLLLRTLVEAAVGPPSDATRDNPAAPRTIPAACPGGRAAARRARRPAPGTRGT